jgi:hypothetical protein
MEIYLVINMKNRSKYLSDIIIRQLRQPIPTTISIIYKHKIEKKYYITNSKMNKEVHKSSNKSSYSILGNTWSGNYMLNIGYIAKENYNTGRYGGSGDYSDYIEQRTGNPIISSMGAVVPESSSQRVVNGYGTVNPDASTYGGLIGNVGMYNNQ